MLGQPISMVLPEVVGYKLCGTPDKLITSTDIVLTVTKVIGVNITFKIRGTQTTFGGVGAEPRRLVAFLLTSQS